MHGPEWVINEDGWSFALIRARNDEKRQFFMRLIEKNKSGQIKCIDNQPPMRLEIVMLRTKEGLQTGNIRVDRC
jgi:hypothetical protein